MLKEFKEFITRGNVIDLAVAVVIGSAFIAVVNAFVTYFITPIIGMVGGTDFRAIDFTINDSTFEVGLFINALITFILIAAAVFFLVVRPLNALAERRKRGELAPEDEPVPTDEALLLAEIRDLLRSQQSA